MRRIHVSELASWWMNTIIHGRWVFRGERTLICAGRSISDAVQYSMQEAKQDSRQQYGKTHYILRIYAEPSSHASAYRTLFVSDHFESKLGSRSTAHQRALQLLVQAQLSTVKLFRQSWQLFRLRKLFSRNGTVRIYNHYRYSYLYYDKVFYYSYYLLKVLLINVILLFSTCGSMCV